MRFVNAPRLGVEIDARPSVLVAQGQAQLADDFAFQLLWHQVPLPLADLCQLHRGGDAFFFFAHGSIQSKAGHPCGGGLATATTEVPRWFPGGIMLFCCYEISEFSAIARMPKMPECLSLNLAYPLPSTDSQQLGCFL